MDRFAEMIQLMDELYGKPETWPQRSQAGKVSPERARLYRQVKRAIRDGILKPEPCQACGFGDNVQAHHADYSKPLDVEWLCASCHARLHASADRQAFLAKLANEGN